MSKVIRLTESDLLKIIKRVIKEQVYYEDPEVRRERSKSELIDISSVPSLHAKNILRYYKNTVKFLVFNDCGYIDFTDIDICSFPNLLTINFRNTPNNFEEVVNCEFGKFVKESSGFYSRNFD